MTSPLEGFVKNVKRSLVSFDKDSAVIGRWDADTYSQDRDHSDRNSICYLKFDHPFLGPKDSHMIFVSEEELESIVNLLKMLRGV